LLRRAVISYALHAVDFLGAVEDEVDSRMMRHPGMTLDLETKLALCSSALSSIKNHREALPLRSIVELLESCGDSRPR
jgi:hypothetical protein